MNLMISCSQTEDGTTNLNNVISENGELCEVMDNVQQWEYTNGYPIDHENGGWYNSGIDKQPESVTSRKSHIWKGNYHTLRALMRVLEGLE